MINNIYFYIILLIFWLNINIVFGSVLYIGKESLYESSLIFILGIMRRSRNKMRMLMMRIKFYIIGVL